MKRFLKSCVVLSLVFASPTIACPPTPLGWTFLDPAAGSNLTYGGNIACEGEAATSAIYNVKVVGGSTIITSQSGTSTQCAWTLTVPEPAGGWPMSGPGMTQRNATLQLWSGGSLKDDEAIILLKD